MKSWTKLANLQPLTWPGMMARARLEHALLFERVMERIHRYFRRTLSDPADAEDCAQETMLLIERCADDADELREGLHEVVNRMQRQERLAFDSRMTTETEERNLYWHLPMSVTLCVELRPPFIKYGHQIWVKLFNLAGQQVDILFSSQHFDIKFLRKHGDDIKNIRADGSRRSKY